MESHRVTTIGGLRSDISLRRESETRESRLAKEVREDQGESNMAALS